MVVRVQIDDRDREQLRNSCFKYFAVEYDTSEAKERDLIKRGQVSLLTIYNVEPSTGLMINCSDFR